MAPKGTIVGALSYGTLEHAFAQALSHASEGREGGVWVLVPTNLLALHLRRAAARVTGGVAGIGFLTLKDAARRMVLSALARKGRRPLPPGAVELVLRRFLDEVPAGSYLASFQRFPNGALAIAHTIRTLEDCLWRPDALREAAAGSSGLAAGDPGAPGRLRELAGIWARLQAWKQENALFEDADLVVEAARADSEPAEHADILFLYGFYDFTPSQRKLLERLILSARRCSAYLLWADEEGRPAAGFEYAAPAVEWLKRLLEADGVEHLLQPSPSSDLERLQEGVFRERALPPERSAREELRVRPVTPDGSVRVISCPGESPEAVEVVRQLLWAAEAPEPRSVGVLLRGAEETAGLLAEALDRAGVRCYVREGLPLALTVAGRVALSLIELAEELGPHPPGRGAERTTVVDFLSLAEVKWPTGLSASALDRVTRQAGITRGPADWPARLLARAGQLRRDAERAEDEAEHRLCAADAQLCTEAAGFLSQFFASIKCLSAPATWRQAAQDLRSLTEHYSPLEDEGTEPVLEAIGGLASMDVTGRQATAQSLMHALGRRLAEQSLRRGRFQHVGPTVSSIMGARGPTFDVVIVPGMLEKNFPRHIPHHSLLTEPDREALNEAAPRLGCGELPLQANRPLEERYLFRLALGSANRTLVLSYPRLEQDSGRPRIPSRFLLDACSALRGWSVSAALLEDGAPDGLVERVPLNRRAWTPAQLGLALDSLEYDAAAFTGPTGDARRIAYLSAVSEPFRQAVQMDEKRWRRRQFGAYDGKIRAGDLRERLRARYLPVAGPDGTPRTPAISPSRFETYARCPFAYFLTYVLEIQEVEEPAEEFQLPALDRGALVHDLLRRLYEERLKGRPLGSLTDEELDAALARGLDILDELGRLRARDHPATWAAERERTGQELRALLAHERAKHAQAAPRSFEYEFGISAPSPFALKLGRKGSVAFRGRIDRVDLLPDGAIQIVDYKTGSSSRYRQNRFLGGRQLQLPIYLLAAAELMEARDAAALYLMVSEPKDVPEFTLSELKGRMADFRKALRLIVDGIAAGDFFPLPAEAADAREACDRYCRYGVVCGAARRSLADIKQTDRDAVRLQKLRSIE
jgi:RecB family exonuclease